MLFGVGSVEPTVIVMASILLIAVAALAGYLRPAAPHGLTP